MGVLLSLLRCRIQLEHELERHQLRVAEANSRKAQQARLQARLAGQRGARAGGGMLSCGVG